MTQNVDGLHQKAGSTDVSEIHGAEVRAVCLNCKKTTTMEEVVDEIIGDRVPADFKMRNNMEENIEDDEDVKGLKTGSIAKMADMMKSSSSSSSAKKKKYSSAECRHLQMHDIAEFSEL